MDVLEELRKSSVSGCKAHRSLEEDWKPVYEGCISMAAEEQGFVASEE